MATDDPDQQVRVPSDGCVSCGSNRRAWFPSVAARMSQADRVRSQCDVEMQLLVCIHCKHIEFYAYDLAKMFRTLPWKQLP